MKETQSFADDIHKELRVSTTAVPFDILLSIVDALLASIMQCFPNDPEGATRYIHNPWFYRRWRIEREVAAKYKGNNLEEMQHAVMTAVSKVTPFRMRKAYSEAR